MTVLDPGGRCRFRMRCECPRTGARDRGREGAPCLRRGSVRMRPKTAHPAARVGAGCARSSAECCRLGSHAGLLTASTFIHSSQRSDTLTRHSVRSGNRLLRRSGAADCQTSRRRSEGGGERERLELRVADALQGVDDERPEPGVVEVRRDLGGAVRRRRRAEVDHGHAEGERAGELDIQRHPHDIHHGRVDHERDGARVVHRRVLEALRLLVGRAEELEQFDARSARGRCRRRRSRRRHPGSPAPGG